MKSKNTYTISLRSAFKDWTVRDQLISLNNSIELLALFRTYGWRMLRFCKLKIGKSTSRLNTLRIFAHFLFKMRKHHGEEYVVKYLKGCQLALQKSIAGTPFSSLREIEKELPLPRLTRSGLPRFIPGCDRRAILNGSPSVVQWWSTVFSVYRVITIPGKLRLETITDPFMGSVEALGSVSLELHKLIMRFKERWPKVSTDQEGVFLWLETSSPLSRASWRSLVGAIAVLRKSEIWTDFLFLLNKFSGKTTKNLFNAAVAFSKFPLDVTGIFKGVFKTSVSNISLGQLSKKPEAAGKIRVFALVDVWTQSVLKPIHDTLFSILRVIPNDATFDRMASEKRCIEKAAKWGQSYGYDLSAATDRLPIELQVAVLSALFGEEIARAWKSLLVNRDYTLLPDKDDPAPNHLRYSTGQPMGALSSWAMLALTHHAITQLAHRRAYGFTVSLEWCEDYELLGDDIIIFDPNVAREYLVLMEELGVPINLSKSVVSNKRVTEFAKVTTMNGKDVSALSWKMLLSQNNFSGRVSTGLHLLRRQFELKSPVSLLNSALVQSPVKEGNLPLSHFMVLLNFVKGKELKFSQLFGALKGLNLKVINPRRLVLKDLNKGFTSSLIHNILTGNMRPLKKFLDPRTTDRAVKTIMLDLDRRLSKLPHSTVWTQKMAKKLINLMLDVDFIKKNHREAYVKLLGAVMAAIEEKFTVKDVNSKWNTVHTLDFLREHCDLFFDRKSGRTPALNIERALKLKEEFDSLMSFADLPERTLLKDNNKLAPTLPKESELKILDIFKADAFKRKVGR